MTNNPIEMICLDIVLSSSKKEVYQEQLSLISPSKRIYLGLKSWGLYTIFQPDKNYATLKKLKDLAYHYNWKTNVASILKNNTFESVIITDAHHTIIWVNDDFRALPVHNDAQYMKANEISKNTIYTAIKANKPCEMITVHYKRDDKSYTCELSIFPLIQNDEPTHFITLEKQTF